MRHSEHHIYCHKRLFFAHPDEVKETLLPSPRKEGSYSSGTSLTDPKKHNTPHPPDQYKET